MNTATRFRPLIQLATALTIVIIQYLSAHALVADPIKAQANFDIRVKGVVARVIDGDTIEFKPHSTEAWTILREKAINAEQDRQQDLNVNRNFKEINKAFIVRFGNIDTPESNHRDPARNTQAGKEAKAYAVELLTGREMDMICWEIGYYGRSICSAWNSEFEFGSHMIQKGFSDYVTGFGRHPFMDGLYSKAQDRL